jgi:hypothetical protein
VGGDLTSERHSRKANTVADPQQETRSEAGPLRRPGIEQSDLPDGLALFDPVNETAHHLNAVAMLIWELCDGRSEAAIVGAVERALEIDPATAAEYVELGLRTLRSQRLLA